MDLFLQSGLKVHESVKIRNLKAKFMRISKKKPTPICTRMGKIAMKKKITSCLVISKYKNF
ncbi:MAG: hypothetical protein DI548_07605 [Flavobacterium johnsoniae]|nr:MAG: hypothetical protein DI548_07605 [Flavobacterium johnsoniae]